MSWFPSMTKSAQRSVLPITQKQVQDKIGDEKAQDEIETKLDELISQSSKKGNQNDLDERYEGAKGQYEQLSSRGLVGMHNAINIDKLLEDENFKLQQSKKVEYIPYVVAEENLKNAVEEMRHIKDSSLLSLAEVEDSYLQYRQATREKYEQAMSQLKSKSMGCIENFKVALKRSHESQKQKEKEYRKLEANLRLQLENAQQQYSDLEKKLTLVNRRVVEETQMRDEADSLAQSEKSRAESAIEAFERSEMSRQELENQIAPLLHKPETFEQGMNTEEEFHVKPETKDEETNTEEPPKIPLVDQSANTETPVKVEQKDESVNTDPINFPPAVVVSTMDESFPPEIKAEESKMQVVNQEANNQENSNAEQAGVETAEHDQATITTTTVTESDATFAAASATQGITASNEMAVAVNERLVSQEIVESTLPVVGPALSEEALSSEPKIQPKYVLLIESLTQWRESLVETEALVSSLQGKVTSWIKQFKEQESRKPAKEDYTPEVKVDISKLKKAMKKAALAETKIKELESELVLHLRLNPNEKAENGSIAVTTQMSPTTTSGEIESGNVPAADSELQHKHDVEARKALEIQLEEQRRVIKTLKARLADVEKAREVDSQPTKSASDKEEPKDETVKETDGQGGIVSHSREGDMKDDTGSSSERIEELETELTKVREELETFKAAEKSNADNPSAKRYMEKLKTTETKLKDAEKQLRDAKTKASRLEQQLEKAERNQGSGGGGKDGDSAKLRKELEELKKKQKKQMDEIEKNHSKTVRTLEKELDSIKSDSEAMKIELLAFQNEVVVYQEKLKNAEDLEKQNLALVERARDADDLRVANAEMTKSMISLEEQYREEQMLRKKYWNMMEDMKGKIRVFARCRPMAQYEVEKNCIQVVQFSDEYTMDIQTERGSKQFVYDRVFGPSSTQDDVFEDTRNLIQSSLDGYNVCVFAYGQTGSGKTHTMVGSPEMPGIVRRSVTEIFKFKKQMEGKNDIQVKLYMLELYLDNLLDLLYAVAKKLDANSVPKEPPKLDIKKDKSGTVFVKGAQMVTVETEEELLGYFEKANGARKVASTKMNAGSSRSHLIFSVVLENTDLTSKKTTIGKLSLVDLAGSERQEKTGATGEQLKEAMSINKSLSALGDVISALSNNESFVPYRNNKLTQLMSDSLGGNAKTLMFVNISPADYNVEETVSSLTYASRVKLITNNADKSVESEELSNLKKVIKELMESGGKSALMESLGVEL